MITALLLLPVLAILVWLYWYLLPGRVWRIADSVILVAVVVLAGGFIGAVEKLQLAQDAGPLWSYIVAAAGAYGILAVGLTAGLLWRRRARPGVR